MDTAVLMLVAALVAGDPEPTKCIAQSRGEVWSIRAAQDAGTCLRLARLCTGDWSAGVRYFPGMTIIEPPFRRCRAHADSVWT